jgi:hypothetical protein
VSNLSTRPASGRPFPLTDSFIAFPCTTSSKKERDPFKGVPLSRFVAEEYGSTAPGGEPQGEVKVITIKIAVEEFLLHTHRVPSLTKHSLKRNEAFNAFYTSGYFLSKDTLVQHGMSLNKRSISDEV